MADRTMLQFDYEEVHGQTVVAVLGRSDGPAGWRSIALVLHDRAVLIEVDPDTDEIVVSLSKAASLTGQWNAVAELAHLVGSALGWCWVGRNYLGYLDMFTLSFSGLEPQICLIGEGSTITIRHIHPNR